MLIIAWYVTRMMVGIELDVPKEGHFKCFRSLNTMWCVLFLFQCLLSVEFFYPEWELVSISGIDTVG